MELNSKDDGVDVYLDISKDYDAIPADAVALVGNRSAVGEQYVELQPQTDDRPYLADGASIPREHTQTPIQTRVLLTHLSDTVESVDKGALSTTVSELGKAFGGSGQDLQQIIDTGNAFIEDANANFDTTTALIRDGNVVLRGQAAKASAIRNFARDLSLFSGTLAGSDADLRKVIDRGSETANQLRTFIEDNRIDLGELINNVLTTGQVVVQHLHGVEQVLVIYPYMVEGGFTVVSKSRSTQRYDAHFGLITTSNPPVCQHGYESTTQRPPQNGAYWKMNEQAHCAEPAAQSNPRGAQHAPSNRAGADYRAPVAWYDPDAHELHWGGQPPADQTSPGTSAPASFGEESWKWLFLQPLT
jgi:phospholipid/cholesterol/gamma-HCH transport system substrate-binding protein